MSNYSATIVRIKEVRKHSNADRLQCTNIFGNNVIVGLETKVGDLGLFFPLESQIGLEFANTNDLIRRKDENGKPCGGMFDENRRVRAQTLRGEKSMGFFVPIDSLDKLVPGSSKIVEEGDDLLLLQDFVISQKYIPKRNNGGGLTTRVNQGRKPKLSRIVPGQFAFHSDTAQLGKNMHKIKPTDQIVLTWKLHGTSAITSNCLTRRKLSFVERLLSRVGVPIDNKKYDYIYASRKVVKNEFAEGKDHYYGYDLWTDIGKAYFGEKLHAGETVYYEVVGFTSNGSYIQKGYDYGCSPTGEGAPQSKVYVYRITRTAPDGTVTELQWNQVKERCREIGVETVPEIDYGVADILHCAEETLAAAGGFTLKVGESEEAWQEKYLNDLKETFVYDQDCQFCKNKVPAEGIVLRKEGLIIESFKLKAFRFFEHETKQLDSGEADIESAEQ